MTLQWIAIRSILAVLGLLPLTGPASAAEPTADECLKASEAALEFTEVHRLHAAETQLLICAAAACPVDVRQVCMQRIDELNAILPSIVFDVRDAAGEVLKQVRVTMDGQLLAEQLEGTALTVEPGKHEFVFETSERAPVTKRLVVREGLKNQRAVIILGPIEVPSSAPRPAAFSAALGSSAGTTPQVRAVPFPARPRQDSASDSGVSSQRVAAIIVGSIGVAGVGLGSAFGMLALSEKSNAEDVCPAARCQTQAGVNKWNHAKSTGIVSTVAFVIGGAGLAGAATLWFTASPISTTGAQVGLSPTGFQLRGTF
jgi:hypothetical protein